MDMRPPQGSIEAKDPFAAPIPGHSLTEDNTKWAWGNPQKVVDPEKALTQAIRGVKSPKLQLEMVKLLMVGTSVEVLVEGYLLQAFHEGRFGPDVGLLIKAPLALYIASIAEEANIPYRFFENDDAMQKGVMDDETFLRMMKRNNPSMFRFIKEQVNKGIREGSSPRPENFLNAKKVDK